MRNQRGVTVLEALVSVGLLSVAALAIAQGVGNAFNESNNLGDRLLANQILQENLSQMKFSLGQYPPVQMGTSTGMYVSCTDKRGLDKKSKWSSQEEVLIFGKQEGKISGLCNKNQIEVQFVPDSVNPEKVKAYVLVLDPKAGVNQLKKREWSLERSM